MTNEVSYALYVVYDGQEQLVDSGYSSHEQALEYMNNCRTNEYRIYRMVVKGELVDTKYHFREEKVKDNNSTPMSDKFKSEDID